MNRAETCLRAAKAVADNKEYFSCTALVNAGASDNLRNDYEHLFSNRQWEDGSWWLSATETRKSGGRELRVLMLCMMAAVCTR